MRKHCSTMAFTVLVSVWILACGDDAKKNAPAAGSLGGPCYGNGTCDGELVCQNNLCVDPSVQQDSDSVQPDNDSAEQPDADSTVQPDTSADDTPPVDEDTNDDPVIPDDDTTIPDDDAPPVDEDVSPIDPDDDAPPVDEDVSPIDPDDDAVAPTGIPCTGQTKCYNNTAEMTCPTEGNDFYGQDAQYAALGRCIPKSYTVSGTSGNDVVTDNNTGLIWQRTLPATYDGCTGGDPVGSTCSWQEAVDYCANLTYGGFNDWRLPNDRELESIVNYGRYNPAIDTDAFPSTPSSFFWSSSSLVSYTYDAWSVSFNVGLVYTNLKNSNYHARCVR